MMFEERTKTKEAINTLNATWLELKLAKLFGRKYHQREGELIVNLASWRGTVYLIGLDRETTSNSEFNKSIAPDTGDSEYDNHTATTFGKRFAGVSVSDEPLPNLCPVCGCHDYDDGDGYGIIAKRRLNTAYVDDSKNWYVSCPQCFEEMCEMYDEMRQEYYSMCTIDALWEGIE